MWYIYTTEYDSAIKKNETGSFVVMWMNQSLVMQSEGVQKEKNNDSILMHTYEMVQMNPSAGQE